MDTEIFKRKFLPYYKKLYYIAYRLLENEADAQDIVQEAYLKMWNKREGLTMISNPEAFSVTLVKNMCFDLLRSGKYLLQKTMRGTGSHTRAITKRSIRRKRTGT